MESKKKDLLTTVGGVLVVGAITFGGALLLLGSSSGTPKAEAHGEEASHEAHAEDAKSEAKPEAGHGEAPKGHDAKTAGHGEAQPKEAKHAEAPKTEAAPKAHEEAKSEGHEAKSAHGKSETKGEHGEAKPEAKPETKKGPVEPLTLDELTAKADALLSRGRADDAIDFYSRANKVGLTGPMAARTLKRWSDAYLQSNVLPLQRRNEKAIELLGRILNDYPAYEGTPAALLDLGDCQRGMGKWQEAYDTFGQYADRFPKGEGVFYSRMNQVDALLALDRALEAVELLKKVSPAGLDADRKAVLLAKTATAKLQLARDGQLPASTSQKAEIVGTGIFSGPGKPVIEEAKETLAPVAPLAKPAPAQPKKDEAEPATHEAVPEAPAESKHSDAEPAGRPKVLAAPKAAEPAREAHSEQAEEAQRPASKLTAPVRPVASAQEKVPAPIRKAALEANQPKVSGKEQEQKAEEHAPAHDDGAAKNTGAARGHIPAGQLDAVKKAIALGQIREARRLMQPFLENDDQDPQQTAELWMEWARLLNDHLSTLKTHNATADAQPALENQR
ncbi:MAG: tetratricopeptide repeat protein [Planctomycetota bacterium]|nr:tetratricopeptide repeat protein [Planctomycetota bacterium]